MQNISINVVKNDTVLFMKKLLGVVVLSLLLSVNVFAESENLYLTCAQTITEDNSDEGLKQYHISRGEISQYWYFDIKNKKSKIRIKAYAHGYEKNKVWHEVKTMLAFDSIDKGTEVSFKNNEYKIMSGTKKYFDEFRIYKLEDQWKYDGHSLLDDKYFTVDFKHSGICNSHIKKEFNKLRKKGISIY